MSNTGGESSTVDQTRIGHNVDDVTPEVLLSLQLTRKTIDQSERMKPECVHLIKHSEHSQVHCRQTYDTETHTFSAYEENQEVPKSQVDNLEGFTAADVFSGLILSPEISISKVDLADVTTQTSQTLVPRKVDESVQTSQSLYNTPDCEGFKSRHPLKRVSPDSIEEQVVPEINLKPVRIEQSSSKIRRIGLSKRFKFNSSHFFKKYE